MLGQRKNWFAQPGMVCVRWLLPLFFPWLCDGADWPQYRGASHNGISSDRVVTDWSGSVTNPVWRIVLTNCLGSIAVSGGRAFTQTKRQIGGSAKEVCVALNVTNGRELWATPVEVANYPNGGVGFDDGPRTTPAVDGDAVYVLTSYNKLYRLNVTNGAVVWQKDLPSIYNGTVIAWQNAASPLLEDGLIFVNVNSAANSLVALHASDGSLAWRSQPGAMTHSTPVLATIQGVRQVIFATQSGLVSLDPQTGDRLWRFNYPFNYSTSLAASPVVDQNIVFISAAQTYGMGSAAARITLSDPVWTVTPLWTNAGYSSSLASHWMTPVARDGFLYGVFGSFGFDGPNAQLKCVELETGEVKWSVNGFGRGGVALADGHLMVLAEKGELVLTKVDTNAYVELGRFQAISDYHQDTNKCWNCLAIADGRAYARSTAQVAVFDLALRSLQFEAPVAAASGKMQLAVRTVDGSPLSRDRVDQLELRASTSLAKPFSQWPLLSNSLVLVNGVVQINDLEVGAQSQQFYIITEP